MAISSGFKNQLTSEEIGERLDKLGKLIDRTKVMYEQYFMGIQKMPPNQLHRDIERRIRELTQLNIRNTGLRFRLATLTQKFGSYNTYWKRTLRKIERGEYVRDVARMSRRAAKRGEDVPEELLLKLPRRVRERILRDREAMAKRAEREGEARRPAKPVAEGTKRVRDPERGVHMLDENVDLDAIFDSLTAETGAPSAPAAAQANDEIEPPTTPRPTPPRGPRRAATRPPASPPARPRRASPPPGMSERESRELFEKYRKARQMVGDRRPVSYEQLMDKLGKQAPQIMRQHNARSVGFSVVIRGDKVVLKAKPER